MTEAIRTPGVIRRNQVVLVVSLVASLIGVLNGGMRLSQEFAGGVAVNDLAADVWFMTHRVLLLVASVIGIFAVRRRWVLGRWLSVGVGVVMLYGASPSLAYGWRAIRGEFAAPSGLLAYTSTEEAVIATFVGVAMALGVATVVLQLAFGSDARRYFGSVQTAESGNEAA